MRSHEEWTRLSQAAVRRLATRDFTATEWAAAMDVLRDLDEAGRSAFSAHVAVAVSRRPPPVDMRSQVGVVEFLDGAGVASFVSIDEFLARILVDRMREAVGDGPMPGPLTERERGILDFGLVTLLDALGEARSRRLDAGAPGLGATRLLEGPEADRCVKTAGLSGIPLDVVVGARRGSATWWTRPVRVPPDVGSLLRGLPGDPFSVGSTELVTVRWVLPFGARVHELRMIEAGDFVELGRSASSEAEGNHGMLVSETGFAIAPAQASRATPLELEVELRADPKIEVAHVPNGRADICAAYVVAGTHALDFATFSHMASATRLRLTLDPAAPAWLVADGFPPRAVDFAVHENGRGVRVLPAVTA